ncbi:MAG: winged helix-turn-helix transcriptional regulator [Thermoproteota archaeon]
MGIDGKLKELRELSETHVHFLRQPYGSFYSMDSLDLQIIEEVRKRGPSNIAEISRVLNVAPSTVSRRLEKMAVTLKLRILTNLAYHKIGIRRAIVEIEPEAGSEAELMERVSSLGYWFQSYRVLGSLGYLVGFKIPYGFYNAYESLLNSLKEKYGVKRLSIHPLGEIVGVGPCFQNYDAESKRWRINWSDIRRSLTESSPIILDDPPGYSMEADPLDVQIMLILESDAQTSMSEIARITGVSVPTVSNRIKKLTANGLILGYVANILPFPLEDSRLLQLIAEFPGRTELQTFASGLLKTPFLLSFQKEIMKPTLFARLYLPNREYPSLSDLLRSLVREGFLKGFSVVELDMTSEQSRKIPVGLLDSKGQWQFG